jgi:hypothetical protein
VTAGAPSPSPQPAAGASVQPFSIDLEATPVSGHPFAPPPPFPPLETVPYSDRIRGKIAERLIWMLAAVILLAFATYWRANPDPAMLQEFLAVLFGPLIALVSAAVGYYFGGKAG